MDTWGWDELQPWLELRVRSDLPQDTEHVHASPSLDDLPMLETVDRDARGRDSVPCRRCSRKLSEMRHLPPPTRHHLAALRYLVFNDQSHIGEGSPVELNRTLHPVKALRRVGIVWIVVHDVPVHQVIQPVDRAVTPNSKDRACGCLVVPGHRAAQCRIRVKARAGTV